MFTIGIFQILLFKKNHNSKTSAPNFKTFNSIERVFFSLNDLKDLLLI